jgi:hypothetical protein
MIVAFLHYGQDDKYARKMIESVQRVMPGRKIVQLTDEVTPAVDGASTVRLPLTHGNPMIFKMEHLARLTGAWMVLDTDVIVKSDLRHVFDLDFDVALTWRDGPIYDPEGNDLTRAMPINCGVMFSRSPEFWRACLEWCSGKDVGWYADQLAVAAVWKRFNVLRLHCDNFNYTPRSRDEDVSSRYVVHYKGKRKEWMCA